MESEAETCVFRGSDGVSETRGWPPPQNQAKSALLTPRQRVGPLEYIQSHLRLSKSTTSPRTSSPLRAVTPGVTTLERSSNGTLL